MSRILIIIVLLVVGFILLKSWQRKQAIQQQTKTSTGAKIKNTRMLRCEQCGLHVPVDEAVSRGGQHFCSLEHAKQHLTKN